jgi:RNA polymerase sigma-70 factor (ECF subfamily)
VDGRDVALVGFNGAHPDREKLRQLYEEHGRGLIAFACSFVRSFAAAEDVLHQVFERLLRSNIELPDPPAPYLYRAVKNAALNHVRDRSRDVELDHDDWLEHPPGMEEAAVMLQSLLRSLPEEQREIIILRIWGQMSFDEAAGTLGIPLKTAASRYRYGLEKLRAEFNPKLKG